MPQSPTPTTSPILVQGETQTDPRVYHDDAKKGIYPMLSVKGMFPGIVETKKPIKINELFRRGHIYLS
jgi:hypothetical protein